MAGLDTTGFTPKTLEEIRDEIETDLRTTISSKLDLSDESPAGQFVGIFASKVREIWEQVAAVYASQNPDGASGDALTSLAYLTGTSRRAATKSTVLCTCDLDAGTYAIGTLIAHVSGDPAARFVNAVEVVSAGGSNVGILFESEETGLIRANATTLTTIAEAVAGWNSVTNPADAELGSEIESDGGLRIRREQELARSGSATVDAVRADVLDVDGVEACSVLENTTGAVVNGVDPYSIECIVVGGADADVAEAIFDSKAATAGTSGSDSESVVDSQGNAHTIYFTRPAVIEIYIDVELEADADTYAGDTAVKEALADFADANYGVGADLIRSRLIAAIFGVAGVLDVSVLAIDDSVSPVTEANFPIGLREISEVDTARITVTSTLV